MHYSTAVFARHGCNVQVFSQWKDALLVVSKALSAHSIGHVSLTGGRQGKVWPSNTFQQLHLARQDAGKSKDSFSVSRFDCWTDCSTCAAGIATRRCKDLQACHDTSFHSTHSVLVGPLKDCTWCRAPERSSSSSRRTRRPRCSF